jgi:hypothetical protein
MQKMRLKMRNLPSRDLRMPVLHSVVRAPLPKRLIRSCVHNARFYYETTWLRLPCAALLNAQRKIASWDFHTRKRFDVFAPYPDSVI